MKTREQMSKKKEEKKAAVRRWDVNGVVHANSQKESEMLRGANEERREKSVVSL